MDLKILGLAAMLLAGVVVVAAGAHGAGVFGQTPAMPHSEAAWKKIAGNDGSHEKMHAAMHGGNGDLADGQEMREMHERMHGKESGLSMEDCGKMHEKDGSADGMNGMHEKMHESMRGLEENEGVN